jgi:hypothetical protein
VIYRQTVRQPDQSSDFYTTGLVEADQYLDAFHLKVALVHAAAVIPYSRSPQFRGRVGAGRTASNQRMEGRHHNRS